MERRKGRSASAWRMHGDAGKERKRDCVRETERGNESEREKGNVIGTGNASGNVSERWKGRGPDLVQDQVRGEDHEGGRGHLHVTIRETDLVTGERRERLKRRKKHMSGESWRRNCVKRKQPIKSG